MRLWFVTAYVIAGGIVAWTHHYFDNLSTLELTLEAIVAVILWPFVLAGVEVDFK